MRFLLLFFFLLPQLIMAQSPFDYGKSKERYFLSRTEIRKLGIESIYIVAKLQESDEISFSSIGFSDSSGSYSVRDDWHVYNGKKIPPLDTLINSAHFVNGSYWEFENDTLISSGMDGRGTLCTLFYEYKPGLTTGMQSCRGGFMEPKRFFYYPNGRKFFTVSYHLPDTLYLENFEDMTPKMPLNSDTTYFVYDEKGLILGTKKQLRQTEIKPVFSEFTYQKMNLYVEQPNGSKLPFERFIDQKIGYRPEVLLLQIHQNAVFTFQYNRKHKHYIQQPTEELE